MNCKSCGKAIKAGAKFCGSCGAKVDSLSDAQGLAFAPNPLGLDKCEIKILEVKGEGPDSDGDIRIEIKYEVTNKSNEDWDYLVARTQVLDANGLPLEETRDTYEQSIAAGDTGEFETYLSSIKFKSLGGHPNQIKVLVNLVACGTRLQKLGEFDVPANPFEMLPLVPFKLGDTLQMVSGNLWKTGPDSDKDSTVNVKTLIQNLTPMHLHEVSVIAEITDKSGRDITNANGSEEVRPGDLCVVSGYGYGKDKQFKGAKISLALRAYFPQATGLCEHTGMEVSAPEASDESDEGEESESDDQSDASKLQRAMGSIKSEITMSEKEQLVCISCRVAETEREPIIIDISQLGKKNKRELEGIIGQAIDLDKLRGYKLNLSKTSIMLSWVVPRDQSALLSALNEAYSDWKVSLERGYPGNIQSSSVDYSDDARGIGSQVKLQHSSGALVDAPEFIAELDYSYTDEGSCVLGYESIDAEPWDVRIIGKAGAEVTFQVWEADTESSFSDWIVSNITKTGATIPINRKQIESRQRSYGSKTSGDWKVNAGWEQRDEDKLICRWIVCWKELEDDHIVGAVAGYSGHGTFEVERFYGSVDEGELTSLWVDSTDRVTDEEIDFDELDDDQRTACEAALDCIWEWNDHDLWSETDEVIMRPEMKKSADEEDMLYYAPDHAEYLGTICELVGLTAGPNSSTSVDHEDSESQKKEPSTRLLYANMKWFEVADQPDDIDDLPEAFGKAQLLWEKDKKGNLPKVLELLSGYVGARFLPSNLNDWEDLFVDPDGGAMPEFEARQVRIVGIDFSTSPIPLCKAEAVFEVEVTDQFAGTDLDDWQDSNSQLSDAVTFYWNIPDCAATEDLDLTSGDNQGVECVCVDRDPFDESAETAAPTENVVVGRSKSKVSNDSEITDIRTGVWRWYSPVNLVDSDENLDPPSSIISKILLLAEYPSLRALMADLNAVERYEIPDPLHSKLKRLFSAETFEDEEFTFRDIEIDHDGESITLPYPLRPEKMPTVDLKISAFSVTDKSKNKVRINARIGVSTDAFLVPRSTTESDFCKLLMLSGSSMADELSIADRNVLKDWLVSNEIEPDLADSAVDNEDFRLELSSQIMDRIEEIVSVAGSSELNDDDSDTSYILEGEEEKGFSS